MTQPHACVVAGSAMVRTVAAAVCLSGFYAVLVLNSSRMKIISATSERAADKRRCGTCNRAHFFL
jgi:hypothetical protein